MLYRIRWIACEISRDVRKSTHLDTYGYLKKGCVTFKLIVNIKKKLISVGEDY